MNSGDAVLIPRDADKDVISWFRSDGPRFRLVAYFG